MYAAITYKSVDQTTSVATSSVYAANASTPNPITTTVAAGAGSMVVAGAISGNSGSYVWNNSFVEGTDQTSGATTNMSSADLLAAAAGNQTASATHSGPNRQAIVAAVINPD